MNVLILGGSGFIGRNLTRVLLDQKRQVTILTRGNPNPTQATENYQILRWNGGDLDPVLDNRVFDVVLNLAGETIGKWPWSAEHKNRVLESRLNVSHQITKYLVGREFSGVYIQASGIGYYGDSRTREIDETAPKGNDFLANVSQSWESAANMLINVGKARTCFARTGIVLSANEGALPSMSLPINLFLGGKLGDGGQGVSWIHIDDIANAYIHLIDQTDSNGMYNFCAPYPVSNADFMREIGKVLNRPVWLPVPEFGLKLILGEMSDLLLHGQYAIPTRLLTEGFVFKFPTATKALEDIYRRRL